MEFLTADNFFLTFQILYILTAIGTIIVIISGNRNPLKTISWVLILIFLPLVGLIFYYFFGEDHRKQRLISKKMHKKLNKRTFNINSLPNLEKTSVPYKYLTLINLLNKFKTSPLHEGNKITFYSDGITKFESLCIEISKAKKFIHIQYYIFMDDKIGNKIKDLLIKKAKEGIEVRLLYDDVGSWKAKNSFFKNMAKEGIQVEPFLKVAFPILTSSVNYRNHRKVVIIDGKVGFMGGMNIADRYLSGINGGIWRDSHIKLEGNIIQSLQTSFVIDWYATCSEFLSSEKYFPEQPQLGNNLMQIATSGPMGQFKEIHQAIFQAILNAKKYVYIQTPYFIPTDALLLAIQTASLSGVDVRIMIPKTSDTFFVQIATRAYIKNLLDAKVKVYLFNNGFIHSKLLVLDDTLTITGSANMDVRSFEHNFEIEAFVYNEETGLIAKNIFLKDQESSELIISEEWDKRPKYNKFTESVLRMFTPLL